jgi:DNA-binding beta-propeller fold protein YncE
VQSDVATIGTVDVLSGTITAFGSGLVNCCTNSVLDAALDAAGSRYFAFLARTDESSQRLLTFSTATGAVTASIPFTSALFINYLAYDTASSQLLALVFAADPYSVQLARIDPATAAFTLLNNPIPDCCSPIAFDAAYDDAHRKLYAVLQPYAGEPQPRLVTFSGADGAVLADVPISTTLELDHLAYDATTTTLWALGYDAAARAERLAVIDVGTGTVTPLGSGAAGCCSRMVTDVAIDPVAQELIAPMVDTSAGGFPVPTFFRFSLTTGEVLGRAPIDPGYWLYYIAYDPAPIAPLTPTATPTGEPTAIPAASLYMPSIQALTNP